MAHSTLLQIDAHGFILPSSNPAAIDVVQDRAFLAFDDTTVQTAYTPAVALPGQYAGGTVYADIAYFMASATAGSVDFEVSAEAVTEGDALDLDSATSFDTPNSDNETVPGTAGHLAIMSIQLSNDDAMAAGDMIRFKLERDADDATNDTATGDARILYMEIWEST